MSIICREQGVIEETRVQVSGQVQGVGFRAQVSRIALKHKIKGVCSEFAGRVRRNMRTRGSPRDSDLLRRDPKKSWSRIDLYPNDFKNWEFGKKAAQIFCSGASSFARKQSASEDKQFAARSRLR